MSTYQDFHFDGRGFIATAMFGESGAVKQTMKFD
jgi:hypothetical protein